MLTQNDKDILTKRIERMQKLLESAKQEVENSNMKGITFFAGLIHRQNSLLLSEAEEAEQE